MEDTTGIMMIEPKGKASSQPVVDEATRKMTAAWRQARHSDYGYRGFHMCNCGACSDNKDHWVGADEKMTNSLAIHYLAYHRTDVPAEELAKILSLPYGELAPTEDELKKPSR